MRRNNEAFTTHLAPDDAESQEVTIKQNTKRASTGRCHACNKFNRNHPRTCCKGTTSDFTSLAMAQQSLVRMCSFFEFCKKSLRDWHLKCLGNPKHGSWDFDDLSNCLSIWATFQVQSGYLEPGPAQIFLEPWEDFGTPFCSIHKALTPEVGWSCLGLAEGYQALEAPTSKAYGTSAFWVRRLDVTNRKGHGLLMFIDALLSGLKKKTFETVKLPGVHGCREAHTPKERQRAAPCCFVRALGEATADCSGEFDTQPRRCVSICLYYIHRLRYISDINIVYTWYTLCAIKYISNIIIASMVTKPKKTSGPCFEDADNVKALMAGAMALVVPFVSSFVVLLWWRLGHLGHLGPARALQEISRVHQQGRSKYLKIPTRPSATLLNIQKHAAW